MQLDILAGSCALQLRTDRRTLLRKRTTTHHDRVDGAIETVISHRGLDMLNDNPGDF
jgi:hypothetical protein